MQALIPSYILPAVSGEETTMLCVEIDSIPANSNPFHYELSKVGTHLDDKTTVMWNTPYRDRSLNHVDIIDGPTGQRWRLIRLAKTLRYDPVVYIRDEYAQGNSFGPYGLIDVPDGAYRSVKPVHADEFEYPAGVFKLPVYFVMGNYAVLESFLETATLESLREEIDMTFVNDRVFNAEEFLQLYKSYQFNL